MYKGLNRQQVALVRGKETLMTTPKSNEAVKELLAAAGWDAEEIATLFDEGESEGSRSKAEAAAVLKSAGWDVEAVTAALWQGLRL